MNYDEKVCVIKKRSDTGDYSFGRTIRVEYGSEDWLDLDDFLKAMSPSGIYERTEVKK